MPIHISLRNTKLGNIPNINLPPGITCVPDAPCQKLCYAKKAYNSYARATCRPAWDENLAIFQASQADYFKQIEEWIGKKKTLSYFRWHASGDIVNAAYLFGMIRVAQLHPTVHFMAFTRRSDLILEYPGDIPKNLKLVRSVWLDEDLTMVEGMPFFKVAAKDKVLEWPQKCPGKCDECVACWHLGATEGRWIHIH